MQSRNALNLWNNLKVNIKTIDDTKKILSDILLCVAHQIIKDKTKHPHLLVIGVIRVVTDRIHDEFMNDICPVIKK